ncbi:hypothetical protein AX14_001276 [Amanita brunnescens Koide BX004]|nr:hypothetical protein AX14_001276 [Amanita brunnescens Koide BX004]
MVESPFRSLLHSRSFTALSDVSRLYTMPNWNSPAEVAKEIDIFAKLMHALLGLYAFEWFISLDFEWEFLSGRKKFRWPMLFYFANRYLLLFTLIGVAIALDSYTPIDCQVLYTFNQLAGDASIGLASINLSIRTIAVWSQNRYIVGLLVLVILGHWTLILQGIMLHAEYVQGSGCVIISTNNTILAAIFIYSMCFDLLVIVLNMYKLLGIGIGPPRVFGKSRLSKLIFADGLIYFLIAFFVNLTATIFLLLKLNPIMSIIFNIPAAVFSTIVACRVVRRLTKFTNQGAELYASHSSGIGWQVKRGRTLTALAPASQHMPTGVHVQMETYTRAEFVDGESNDFDTKEKTPQQTIRGDYSVEVEDIESKGAAL